MGRIGFVFLLIVSLAGVGAGSAKAARLQASDDATIERLLRENPGYGVLIADLVMRGDKGDELKCGDIILTFRNAESKFSYIQSYLQPQPFGLGDGFSGGITAIKPGSYTLFSIRCALPGVNRVFNGDLVKIAIRPGEIVAVGTLVVDYKESGFLFGRKFSANVHVKSFRSAAQASLKKRIPKTLAKARRSAALVVLAGPRNREKLKTKQ